MTNPGSSIAVDNAAEGAAVIKNHSGLHARPAVKLTKLAKRFSADVRMRIGPQGDWVDAKSVVKVMGMRAAAGETLYFSADGPDAEGAVQALLELTLRDFDEGSPAERQFKGQVASSGFAVGVIVRPVRAIAIHGGAIEPKISRSQLERAIASASRDLEGLLTASDRLASEILEFQLEFLKDTKLTEPAFEAIAQGSAAAEAWTRTVDRELAGYRAADNEYFRARTSDLADLRDRVLAALNPDAAAKVEIPEGAVYLADDLPPSRFLELDWGKYRGAALLGGSVASHVSMLARSRGVPLLVQVAPEAGELLNGAPVILDAEGGHLITHPAESSLQSAQKRISARETKRHAADFYRTLPAIGRGGQRIRVYINVEDPEQLTRVDPAECDGIGLVRTEFLFRGVQGLPDEETQFLFYRRLVEWARGRPVTIRTLDAGGDKPIAGLTPENETNPFLGVRGVRLSLARPEVFRQQLRALARVAVLGPVRVMLPMVTVPGELETARKMLVEEIDNLIRDGIPARMPELGMMVEVPAAALTAAAFNADFYSIGSNDLIQYTMAASRDCSGVANLYDARNGAVLELIARVAAHGAASGRDVSLCGEMASDPTAIAPLLDAGLTALSVTPVALAQVKFAIAEHGRKAE